MLVSSILTAFISALLWGDSSNARNSPPLLINSVATVPRPSDTVVVGAVMAVLAAVPRVLLLPESSPQSQSCCYLGWPAKLGVLTMIVMPLFVIITEPVAYGTVLAAHNFWEVCCALLTDVTGSPLIALEVTVIVKEVADFTV